MAKALVTVAGYALPEPSSYSGSTSTLVDAGRNVEGKFIGSVVRSDVAKVELKWNYLTVQEWANINQLFLGPNNFVREVEFFDQARGTWTVREMYVSDRSAGMWRRHPVTGDVLGWTDCTLSLIEV
jgi:hypothetical protein